MFPEYFNFLVAGVVFERIKLLQTIEHSIQGLYQHAAALRTMQDLTQTVQHVKAETTDREADARAKGRLVEEADAAEREAQAAVDSCTEAFKLEQEAVAAAETSVRKAEAVCSIHRSEKIAYNRLFWDHA